MIFHFILVCFTFAEKIPEKVYFKYLEGVLLDSRQRQERFIGSLITRSTTDNSVEKENETKIMNVS